MAIYGLTETVYKITLLVSRLAYLNLLWVLGSLAGGVLLGVAPASVASIHLLTIWSEERSAPIGRTFFQVYKSAFISSNKLAIIFLPLCFFIIAVLWNLQFWHHPYQPIVIYSVFGLSLPFFNFIFFLLPTLFFFKKNSISEKIISAFKVSASSPHWFLLTSIGILITLILLFYSGFIFFFFASVSLWIATKTYRRIFEKLKEGENQIVLN